MIARLAERRFLAVLGSSGTGKSSLVKTGLLSSLTMGLLSGAGSRWLIVEFRPGGNPLRNLARALLEAETSARRSPSPEAEEIDRLWMRFKQEGPRELIKWCGKGRLADGNNLLILVDQFEELFRYQSDDEREDAQALVSLLLESRWPRGIASPRAAERPIYVMITLRSEYLGACTLIQGLAEAINEGSFLVPRMTRWECEEAIVGPARVCGIEVEPRLVTRLLNDMADFAPWDQEGNRDQLSRLARRADQLPLMQYALNQIWRRTCNRCRGGETVILRYADYRGLEQEFDDHAEQVFNSLDASLKPVAERVFRAVTFGTSAANAVRRPTRYDHLVQICGAESGKVAAVMTAFGPRGCQFLTSDLRQTGERPPNDAWIDIAHECLIRQWKRLSMWLEIEGHAAREWQRLKDDVDKGGFISGWRLKEAIRLRDTVKPTPAWAGRYGGDFQRVNRLIATSQLRKYAIGLTALVITALGGAIAFYQYQATVAREAARDASVSAAQSLLKNVLRSIPRGDITVNAANNVLQVANSIVDQQAMGIKRTPKDIGLLINVACTASDIYAEIGNYAEAYRTAKEAKDLADPLRKTYRDDRELLQLLYSATWRIGDAISFRGRDRATQDEALKEYGEAKTLVLQLVAKAPEALHWQRELMFIDQKIGDAYQTMEQFDPALAEYRTALAIVQDVVAKEPRNLSSRRDLANSMIRIGQVLAAQSNFDGAMEQYRDALDIRTKLADEDPSDDVTQSNLASNHRVIAMLFAQVGGFDAALQEYQLAIEIQQALIFKDPGNAVWQFSLAVLHAGLANILKAKGEKTAALEQSRYAYAIRQALARRNPLNPSRQNSLAQAGISVADLLTEQTSEDPTKQTQNLDAAMKLYRSAIETLDESRPLYDRNVFDCYIKIGDIFNLWADWDGALKEYRTALGIALGTVVKNPDSVIWQRNLATSYVKVGDTLTSEPASQESSREATVLYQKALSIVTALVEKFPNAPEFRSLAEFLNAKIRNLGSRT
jgi:tetratricopeptide (TPR) repeat protein